MKVSVVVCTYSSAMYEHFIECIESLLNQTYEDIEIICIVDGDMDYYEYIRREKGELFDDNVKLHLNYKNLGLLESRNKGVEMANGDVVAFIDDDAVAEKNWIEELVKMYKMGAIAAGGKIVPFWVAKKPIWLPEEFYWMIGATYLGFPEKVTEVRNTFGSNLSFKRDIFLRLGGFNVKMGGIKGSKMLQGGETELCERMRKRYGKGLTYNPDAIVYHKVFEKRTKLSFLIKRAFWQGYSKAVMEGIAGDIGEEKGFLRYLLINRTLSRLNEAIRGSGEDLSKLIFIWIFTTCVGAGYIYAKF